MGTILNTLMEEYSANVYEFDDGRLITYPTKIKQQKNWNIDPFDSSDRYDKNVGFYYFKLGKKLTHSDPDEIEDNFESLKYHAEEEFDYDFRVRSKAKDVGKAKNAKSNIFWRDGIGLTVEDIYYKDEVPMIKGKIRPYYSTSNFNKWLEQAKKYIEPESVEVRQGQNAEECRKDANVVFKAKGRCKNFINTFYHNQDKIYIICLECGKVKMVKEEEIPTQEIKKECTPREDEGFVEKLPYEISDTETERSFYYYYKCSCGNIGGLAPHVTNQITGLIRERVVIREKEGASPKVQVEQDLYNFIFTYPKECKDEWNLSKTIHRSRYTYNVDKKLIYKTDFDVKFKNGHKKEDIQGPVTVPYSGVNSTDPYSEDNARLLSKIFNVPSNKSFSGQWFAMNYSFEPLKNDSLFEKMQFSPNIRFVKDEIDHDKYNNSFLRGIKRISKNIIDESKRYPKQIRKKIYQYPSLLFYIKKINKTGIKNIDILNKLLEFIIDNEKYSRADDGNYTFYIEYLKDLKEAHGEKAAADMLMKSISFRPYLIEDSGRMYSRIKKSGSEYLIARNGKPVIDIGDWVKLHDELSLISSKLRTIDMPIKTPNKIRERLEFQDNNMLITFPTHTHELIDIGSKMSICVGGEHYQNLALTGSGYIMYAAEKKTGRYIACIEIGRNLQIKQLKGYKNGLIEEGYRKELLLWVNKTGINKSSCYDIDLNKNSICADKEPIAMIG